MSRAKLETYYYPYRAVLPRAGFEHYMIRKVLDENAELLHYANAAFWVTGIIVASI